MQEKHRRKWETQKTHSRNILLKRHFVRDIKLLYKNECLCFSVLIQELKLVITQKLYFTFDYDKNQPLSKKL